MPDIQGPPLSRWTRFLRSADRYLYWTLRNGLLATAWVSVLAIVFAYFHIELGYVAGAFLAVFARRLAEKPIAPQVREQRRQETPERGPWRDPMAALGDYRLRYPLDERD